jgi:hypothetical protein
MSPDKISLSYKKKLKNFKICCKISSTVRLNAYLKLVTFGSEESSAPDTF